MNVLFFAPIASLSYLMTNLTATCASTMIELHKLTSSMKEGKAPNPFVILGIQSDLVDLYRRLGEEMSQKFGAKERATITRRAEQARIYMRDRFGEVKKAAKDSETASLLAVAAQLGEEASAAESFMLYENLLFSLDRAIRHSAQVVSFLGKSENMSS